jgi:hypothetical protein
MSWHFSQALEAAFLGEHSSDGARFAPWKLTPTAPDDSCSDKMKDTFHRSPFGMMFVPSTDETGAALLMWCLEASRARTSVVQEQATDSTENAADCGENLPGSFAKYDRASRSWRTRQFSLLGGLTEFSETWPNWGLMLNGECLALTTPDSITAVSESGLLPTPLATDCKGGAKAPRPDNGKLRNDQWRDYVKMKYGLTYPHPTHSEIRLGWPAGWSDFAPLETDKFQAWRRLHGGF